MRRAVLHLEGNFQIHAPRQKVWDFISDPEKIAHCLPDLENFQTKDSKTFSVTVRAGISFVRGSFKFDFTLLDQQPPSHSRFEAIGKGAGVSVKLDTSIDLNELSPNLTELAWKADAQLGGLLGELSPSLIQNSTTKLTQDFFNCLKSKLEPGV